MKNNQNKIWKFGQWVNVQSPLKGDINKKDKKGQEIRIATILSYNPENKRFKVQMLTNKDLKDSNWILVRKNNDIVSGREHYKVNIWKGGILGSNQYIYESNLTDKEIDILVSVKDKEIYKSDGTFLGNKKELGISTRTFNSDKDDNIYNSIKNSPGYNNLFAKEKKKTEVSIKMEDEEMLMS